jgi:hypothetical protein
MGHIESAPQPTAPTFLDTFLEDAREWCRGRMWIPRGFLLLFLVYLFTVKFRDPTRWTIFYGITLGFHEMGHLVFAWAPHFITAIMGSVFQIAIPIGCVFYFARQPDYFGMSVGGFWLSYSLYELSAYIGDARSRDLPLVGFASSEDLEHDWGYILGALHALPADHFLAFLLRMGGLVAGLGSCVFAVWLLVTMARSRNARGFAS